MAGAPVIIDTDPGIDDVVALALALRSPELDVVALTTSYGNATLAATTRNARALLGLAGRGELPVHPGAERPFRRPLTTAPETHGATGVGYAAVPEERPTAPNPAVLCDVMAALGEPAVLVTLGPLTNLAAALDRDRDLVRRSLVRHVGMFGSLRERGNTNRWADFNAWSDPEAADAVLRAGLPTEMVGLDVTRRLVFSAAEVQAIRADRDPLRTWLGAALTFYVEFHRRQERLDGCVVNDVLPIAELIRPGLLGFRSVSLEVNLDAGEHRGHTMERPHGVLTPVALEAHVPGLRTLLGRVFGPHLGAAPASGPR